MTPSFPVYLVLKLMGSVLSCNASACNRGLRNIQTCSLQLSPAPPC